MGKQYKTTDVKVKGVHEQEKESFVVGSFFNGLQIPQDSKFDLYKHKNQDTYFLHGENSTLEYNGYTHQDAGENQYVVAVYDAKEKAVELFKAPVITGAVTSLEKRVHKGPRIKSRGALNAAQRTALGRAFGTKKSKAAIANIEKNRIEADNLSHMEMDIVDNVKEFTSDLPTLQSLQSETAVERPTPKANEDATRVEDIYLVEDIVSERELSYIRVGHLLEEEDPDKRIAYLPYGKSSYINKAMEKYISLANTKKLQLTYYVSLMIAVYNHPFCRTKEDLMEKLENKPAEALVDGILERYAISRASQMGKTKDRSYVIDPFHQDKLLCHALALMFHLEGFLLEILPVAAAFNIKPTRVQNLLRALGASVKPVGVGEAQALGLSKREAQNYKVASLKVPFVLPTMMKRGKRR